MKQPGQKESRAFGRLFATELHEPRYWYAVDALDLIDLQIEVERGSHDFVRKFLQQKLPASFLDRVGKERRELDDIEARKELPSGSLLHSPIRKSDADPEFQEEWPKSSKPIADTADISRLLLTTLPGFSSLSSAASSFLRQWLRWLTLHRQSIYSSQQCCLCCSSPLYWHFLQKHQIKSL
jgi:hypothetical protein